MTEIKVSGTFKGMTDRLMTGKRYYSVEFSSPEELDLFLHEHEGETFHFDIKPAKRERKRSLSANSYAWALIEQISRKTKLTKEDVYREEVRKLGVGEKVTMPEEVLQTFTEKWRRKGLGWLVERIGPRPTISDEGEVVNEVEALAIYGSSTFTTSEMSQFIDNILQDCKELGIPVLSDSEIALLKEEWH